MEFTKEQEVFQQVVTEAWENPAFKLQLMEDPKGAIESLTGTEINLPEGKTIVVNDQTTEGVVYINIPTQVDMDDIELTEDQLEIISGGGSLPSGVFQNSNPLDGLVGG